MLQDAVPLTLGQEFSGYAHQVQAGLERVEALLPRLYELAIGMNWLSIGTGYRYELAFDVKWLSV